MKPIAPLFYVLLLTSCIGSWISPWAIAAPIPAPIKASTSHPQHQQHVAQGTANPGGHIDHHVVQHGAEQHVMGKIAVHPSKTGSLNEHDLHAHLAQVKQTLAQSHPNHVIHGVHNTGDSHIHFHATPVTHPGSHPNNSPSHAVATGYRQGPPTPSPFHAGHFTANHVQEHPGVHGHGFAGTIDIHPQHHQQMPQHELDNIAKGIKHNLTPVQSGARVHVTHTPGQGHVHYSVVPEAGKRIPHPNHLDHTLTQQQGQQIHGHIDQQHQFWGAGAFDSTATGAHPHTDSSGKHIDQRTFQGRIEAHSTQAMTHAHLEVYAQRYKDHIIQHHNIHPDIAKDLVVAATHKQGDSHVHFSSQPKGDLYEKYAKDSTQYPEFNRALANARHTKEQHGEVMPQNHAELGALRHALESKSVTTGPGFHDALHGHVIGVVGGAAGPDHLPCDKCHNTLAQLPVAFKGMHKDVQPGIQRAAV